MATEASPNQQQRAENAASLVIEKDTKEKADEKIQARAQARKDRATNRVIKGASETTPELAFQALASPEGEGWRTGPDWIAARGVANIWKNKIDKALNEPTPRGFLGTLYDKSADSYNRSQSSFDKLAGTKGMMMDTVDNVGAAAEAGKQWIKINVDANKAHREFRSFVRTNATAIDQEKQRLITAKVENNIRKNLGDQLSPDEYDAAMDEAITNVRVAVAFAELQRDKVNTVVKNNEEVGKQVAKEIGIRQVNGRILSDKEVQDIWDSKVNPLTEKAMSAIVAESAEPTAEEENQAIDHASFVDNLAKAFAELHVTLPGTPLQIEAAQRRAVELTRARIKTESTGKQSEQRSGKEQLQSSAEWQAAYLSLLGKRMKEKETITSDVETKLEQEADNLVQKNKSETAKAEAEKTRQTELAQAKTDRDQAKTAASQAELDARRSEVHAEIAQVRAEAISLRETAKLSGQDKDNIAATNAEARVAALILTYEDSLRIAKVAVDRDPNSLNIAGVVKAEAVLQAAKDGDAAVAGKSFTEAEKIAKDAETARVETKSKKEELQDKATIAEMKVEVLEKAGIHPTEVAGLTPIEAEEVSSALRYETPQERADALNKLIEKKTDPKDSLFVTLLTSILAGVLVVAAQVVAETGRAVTAGTK